MGARSKARPLTAKRVERLTAKGRYPAGEVPGLYLQVVSEKNRSWVLRYERDGRERMLGLGPLSTLSLKEARAKARKVRQQLEDGVDPLDRKTAERATKAAEAAKAVSFREAAERCIEAKKVGWRNAKHAEQWRNTLATYAFPILGPLPVAAVDVAAVVKVLTPIWSTKNETAVRVRGRIATVLGWAKAMGLRVGPNPAEWKENLDALLPKPAAVRKAVRPIRHHPALPFEEIPAFMAELRANDCISARALEFTILCATRTSEAIFATDGEFDLDKKLWTIPAARTKTNNALRIPLSDRAVEIITTVPREEDNPYIFVGAARGKPLSNMAMLELLRGMRPGLTVHGTARSAFRDWAAEVSSHPNFVVEMALGHKIDSDIEAAYRRGDLLAKRAKLLADWAAYCGSPNAEQDSNVVQFASAG